MRAEVVVAVGGEVVAAGGPERRRMLSALREAVARAGGVRRISGLSLIAALCASAVAPLPLVAPAVGATWAAWLATAGAIGSNTLADVILGAIGRRPVEVVEDAAALERAVAGELEARMAGPGPQAAVLRGEVAVLLRERGGQRVLLEALAEGDGELQVALAESVALLAGQFVEFTGLLGAVLDGVRALQETARVQQAEIQAQGEHRREVRVALARIEQLLEGGLPAAGGVGVVYNTLPPDTAAFTGRDAEVRKIIGRMRAAAARGGVVAIHAIDGMPGVGKTALAVHVAHALAAWFPDLQLFVDLHAHSADRPPADAAATLSGLLIGDGVDPRQLPSAPEQLSALWRARMATRRALLVLDNAASSAQVAPLLPGGDACLVLITSRRHLGDLPYAVADISLDVLPPGEAVAMFVRLSPRAAAQRDQVAELVELAGHLPLAITLLARVHTRHHAWSISDLIHETRARLLTLTAEDQSIAAAFDLSYRALTPPRQHFFRLLSLHPGGDLDPYAAAALTGTSLHQAEEHLDALHGDHLLTEPSYHRYGMHDLIRAYARDQAHATDSDDQREAAMDGVLHYYAHTAQAASVPLARTPRPMPDGSPPAHAPAPWDLESSRTWLRNEHANLDAAHAYTVLHHLDRHNIALAAGMAEILATDGPWTRALDIHQSAADAAQRRAQPVAHAAALIDLGQVRYFTGDYPGAANAQEQALEINRQLGNRLGEAAALTNLGQVAFLTGDYPGAASVQAQALALFRQLDNRLGEAAALIDLGRVLFMTGDYSGAADAQAQALKIARQLGNRFSEAGALTNLGQVWSMTGNYPEAADAEVQALEIYRQLGHRLGEATALNNLGHVRFLSGNYPGAADAHSQALEIARELGNRLSEAAALNNLGQVRLLSGDYLGAADAHTQALEINRQLGNRGNEAYTLNHYAAAIAALGERARALALYQQALKMNRELNKPDDEALSLEGIAEHYLATGDATVGTEYLRQALAIYRRLGMRPDIKRMAARIGDLADPGAHNDTWTPGNAS